jgi:hypothetical protein
MGSLEAGRGVADENRRVHVCKAVVCWLEFKMRGTGGMSPYIRFQSCLPLDFFCKYDIVNQITKCVRLFQDSVGFGAVSKQYYTFGGVMRKLVLILIAFIAMAFFIKAFDNGGALASGLSVQTADISNDSSD